MWKGLHAIVWIGIESQGDPNGIQRRRAQDEEDEDRDRKAYQPSDSAGNFFKFCFFDFCVYSTE
jgi:hypothetical protein